MPNIIYGTDTDSVEDASQCVLIDVPEHLDVDDILEEVKKGGVFMQSVVGDQDTLEALTLILQGESLSADMIDRILTSLTDAWANNVFDPWTTVSGDPTDDDD